MFDCEALTKVQSIILITLIVIAGVAAYILLRGNESSENTINIGFLADLDALRGKKDWQWTILAAEQINDEGGLLGRKLEIIAVDHDLESGADMNAVSSAMTRLITYHDVDFILGFVLGDSAMVCQDIASLHKKVFIAYPGATDNFTQRVLDDYENYKYSFNIIFNTTSTFIGMTDNLLVLREDTGFNKVGYLGEDLGITHAIAAGLENFLLKNGFELVYKGKFPLGTVDFSSYFAAAEQAGVEILLPLIGLDGGIPFIKEYYDRQSPMVVYGGVLTRASDPEAWEATDGKCEHVSTGSLAMNAKYSLTSKTLPAREAYIAKWGEPPGSPAAFDAVRYILADAIKRAGTIETEAVIKALEETSIETTSARNFVFTESHSVMMGENPNDPNADYMLALIFQWQNGELIPVYPKKIMEEAGATYTFPDWSGPWDEQ